MKLCTLACKREETVISDTVAEKEMHTCFHQTLVITAVIQIHFKGVSEDQIG